MAIRRFDEPGLIRALNALVPSGRAAFAAACAQRLSGAAIAFWKDSPPLLDAYREQLGAIWPSIMSVSVGASEQASVDDARQRAVVCEDLSGNAEDSDDPAAACAADAAASLAYAWRCLATGGKSQEAAWAARRAYEAVNAVAVDSGLPADGTKEAEARIDGTVWVQTELERQLVDIGVLTSLARGAAMERLRVESESAGRRGWPPR